MAYIGIPPFGQTVRTVTSYTATASQTTFTPTGGYIVGYVDVNYNGVKLVNGDDYTATNGSSVVLTTGATAGDSVEITAYMPVSLTDTYRTTESDSRYVNVTGDTMTGALNLTGGGGSAPLQVKQTRFGYSSGYSVLQLGSQTSGQTISLYVDPSTNSSGSFNGNASELLVPEQFAFIAPTATNTTFKNVMTFNDGRVTMPNQPKFRAARVNGFATTTYTEVTFESELFDDGSNYNTSNGRFTAPVAGTYFFRSALQPITIGIGVSINFYVNGVAYGYMAQGWNTNLPARSDISVSALLKLSAGDYVSVYAFSSASCSWDNHGQFQGYLVG
jgi:hypothetical protein